MADIEEGYVGDAIREWTERRDRAVWSEYGIASLAATHWLVPEGHRLPGVPGVWHAEDGAAVGEDVGDLTRVVLTPGESLRLGSLLLRGFARDADVALRVLDPEASAARGISSIDRFAHDDALHVTGRFVASTNGQAVARTAIDDHRVDTVFDGVVRFDIHGAPVELSVEEDGGALFAAFSDATSGTDSYPFRFIRLPEPAEDGIVEVDLNRAFLPPCAFSDHYVCVLPPPGNRWDVAVRAGERFVR